MVGCKLCVLILVFVLGILSSDSHSQAGTFSTSISGSAYRQPLRVTVSEKCITVGGTRVCLEDDRDGRRPRENGRRPRERKCPPGYVVLEKPNRYGAYCEQAGAPAPAPAPGGAGGAAGSCKPGFVWRNARNGDVVCVTPQERDAAASQSLHALGNRVEVNNNTCKPGLIWRNAWDGDDVCVTPQESDDAQRQNREGPSHTW